MKPDLVVYLQARTDVLLARVRRRGRDYERSIDGPWLEALAKAYNDFFFHYDETPLLVVNASDVDLEGNTEDLEALLAVIRKHRKGTQHVRATRHDERIRVFTFTDGQDPARGAYTGGRHVEPDAAEEARHRSTSSAG